MSKVGADGLCCVPVVRDRNETLGLEMIGECDAGSSSRGNKPQVLSFSVSLFLSSFSPDCICACVSVLSAGERREVRQSLKQRKKECRDFDGFLMSSDLRLISSLSFPLFLQLKTSSPLLLPDFSTSLLLSSLPAHQSLP